MLRGASGTRFYRVTLYVSAVFAVGQCPSVRLSHTAEDIAKLLCRPGSPIIVVFFNPSANIQIPRGTPSAGAQNTRGWDNFAILD